MEVLKQTFEEKFPEIKQSILDADFISIDAEFTGLTTPMNTFQATDDLDTRYQKIKASVKEYTIIQYGVCVFKRTGDNYVAKPYNFYIFGCDTDTITSSRSFGVNASSLSFLRQNNFDFNKLIDGGIPFYNYPEEAASFKTNHTTVIREIPVLSQRQERNVEAIRLQIKQWLQRGTYRPLTVQVNNSSMKVFVRQELQRPEYGGFLEARTRDSKHMEIWKITEEERNKRRKRQGPLLNFRRVIEAIQDSGCPVVAHNGILDLCHTIGQFWTSLPEDISELRSIATNMWPNFVDTKYLAEFHPQLKDCFTTSVLGSLYNTVAEELQDGGPSVVMAEGYDRYAKETGGDNALHEAGYDAYMTGVVYLGFVHYIKEKEEEESVKQEKKTDNTKSSPTVTVEETPSGSVGGKNGKKSKRKGSAKDASSPTMEEAPTIFFSPYLTEFYNRVYSMRTVFPYIDLKQDQTIARQDPDALYLNNIPQGLTTVALEKLYPELQPLTVTWMNNNCAWLKSTPQKLKLAPLGMLGKDKVREFLQGGSRHSEGVQCGITAGAASMELLTHEQWEILAVQEGEKDAGVKEGADTASEIVAESNVVPEVPNGGFGYHDLDFPVPDSFSSGSKRRENGDSDACLHARKLQRYE
ncbi:hypothetical protein EC973_004704 [Apophysomyces ossiformis]|uniref:Uncharacterized protein n=1 Tax=Apophysomyces ossiformis TaxID=679940 RepID=A0A8H7BFM1_9FUNG|nr:hypothetical protein EC973_004704 [Apophysomyces ossiformis]